MRNDVPALCSFESFTDPAEYEQPILHVFNAAVVGQLIKNGADLLFGRQVDQFYAYCARSSLF